jgi:hypothetical protein
MVKAAFTDPGSWEQRGAVHDAISVSVCVSMFARLSDAGLAAVPTDVGLSWLA